ncbi:MAG: PAS domain S-box protein [Sedimentisphaerales bacterium]
MDKNNIKLFPMNIAAIEFIIIVFAAIGLFMAINSLDSVERFYQSISPEHEKLDKILLAIAFGAALIMIFSVRRWLELRKTYKILAKSQEQLRFQETLLNEIGDSITATDLEGKITYVNKAECKLVKRSKDELIGKSVDTYSRGVSSGPTQREIIQATCQTGRWEGEVTNTASDGSKLIIECHTWLMKDESGRLTGMCGTARDITEKKLRESDLYKHKQYLEALDKASEILLLSISQIQYDDFLAALGTASGADRMLVFLMEPRSGDSKDVALRYSAQWCKNENIKYINDNATNKLFMKNIWPGWEKTLSAGQAICSQAADLPAEEQSFWNELNVKTLLVLPIIVDEKLEGFIGVDNCTENRQWTESERDFLHAAAKNLAIAIKRLDYKKELKQERDFAQRLVETAQTIVLVMDTNGNIITFNPYFEKLTGYKLEDVKGKNWFNIFLPYQDKQKITQLFQNAIHDVNIDGNVNPIITNDGRLLHIQWYGRTLKDYDGKIIGVLSTGHDITERIKAEEELKKAHLELEKRVQSRTAELQGANTALLKAMTERDHIQKLLSETEKLAAAGKLAAQIAHEINNPLAGIKNSFLLVKDAIPASHRYFEYVGRIEKEIDRVSQIVRQMFDLYQPQTSPAGKFRLYETIRDIVELLKVSRQEKNIHIEIDCDENIFITLSESLLRQVIYNVVQNAIQACGEQATVKIFASVKNDELKLSVSDQGLGIDDTIKDKIFMPFFTTGSGGPKSGLGLGLSITKDIIVAMDGSIDFVSEKGKGTTFNISIPVLNEKI